jgi:cytochrome c-type biogenesis protein CcmH
MRPLAAAVALAAAATLAFGQAEEVAHPDAKVEQRLKSLAEELRCLVCQNQTIADSNAPLALDLRNQIRSQVAQGRSDDQIRAYMVDRYGDFVLYRPPLKAATIALWLGPFLLLAVGAAAFVFIVRRKRAPDAAAPAPQRRAEIEAMLEGREGPRATSGGRPSAKR